MLSTVKALSCRLRVTTPNADLLIQFVRIIQGQLAEASVKLLFVAGSSII